MIVFTSLFTAAQVGQNPIRTVYIEVDQTLSVRNGCGYARLGIHMLSYDLLFVPKTFFKDSYGFTIVS